MNKKELLEQVKRMFDSQRVGVLATHYKNTPHQSLITYIHSKDLREIYFISPGHTRKVEALTSDPRVSLIVDNRHNLESDFDTCTAVTAKGAAEELSPQPRPPFLSRYLKKHPYLVEFVNSPSSRYLRIKVNGYTMVSGFQKVEELSL